MRSGQRLILLQGVGWALPGAALDLDFAHNRAYPSGPATSFLSVTRTTTGMAQWLDGHWSSFGSGQARITDKGLLVEEARTNDALWSRDMTNAAWVKVNMTAALTAAGIDNAANSASTLTATAGNATVLQTITLTSQADTYSVFLQRITGAGTINITVDGGVTWTPVVLTTAYKQFQVVKTAANPVIGIQIVTNGDVIAADFNQLEPGGFATSPILTTTIAVTRNADVPQVIGAGATIIPASASAFFRTFGVEGITTNARMLTLGSALLDVNTPTLIQAFDGTNTASATPGTGTAAGTIKAAFGLDNTSMTAIANGGTLGTNATSVWATQAAGQTPFLGNNNSGIRAINGYIQRSTFAIPKGIWNGLTSP